MQTSYPQAGGVSDSKMLGPRYGDIFSLRLYDLMASKGISSRMPFHFIPRWGALPTFLYFFNFLYEIFLGLQRSYKTSIAFIYTLYPASPDVKNIQNHSTVQ